MAKTICLAQQKGGTSKTTSVWNIAACLNQAGYKVLAVDADAQSNLTTSFGIKSADTAVTLYTLLTEPEATADQAVVSTEEGVDLIPADLELSAVDFRMKDRTGRERVLDKKLKRLQPNYDFIIIDTAPDLGLVTLNALTAADYLLAPIQPEPYCLRGMQTLSEIIETVKEDSMHDLRWLGVFVSMYDARITAHREIAVEIRDAWRGLYFDTIVRKRSGGLSDAVLGAKPIVGLRPTSELAQDYQALTKEIIDRVEI